SLSLSFLLSHLYFDLWFFADRRLTEEYEIEATVTDITYAKSYGGVFTVKTEPIGDAPLSRYRLRVRADTDTASLSLGDHIRFRAKIRSLGDADGEVSNLSLYAGGYSGYVTIDNYTTLFKDNSYPGRRLSLLRFGVQDYLEKVGGEGSPLLAALLLGDRSDFSGTVKLDFQRIGISHLLAVSGMHLAVLSAFLHRLLLLFGVGKKFRVGITSLFALFYMALTGFSPSVLRAGIMLLLASLLFLFAGTSDSLTSLSVSVFVICLFTPYAVFDLSLLLSALATLGILIAPKPKEEAKHPIRRLLLSSVIAVFLSFFAVSATLAITVFVFGRVSLLSAFTTLIFGFLVEVFMILGVLSLPFGYFLPTEVPLSFLSDLILRLAGVFSDLPSVYIAADFPLTKILTVILTVAFLLFLVLKIRHRKSAIALLLILFLSVFVSAGISSCLAVSEERVDYRSDGESEECIFVTSDGEVATLLTAGGDSGTVSAYLTERHITEIDSLIFTSYPYRAAFFLRSVTSAVKIRSVTFPIPRTNEERFLLHTVEEILSEARVECRTTAPDATLTVGDTNLRLLSGDGFTLVTPKTKIAYFSRSAEADSTATRAALLGAKTIVFGLSGRKTEKTDSFNPQRTSASLILLTKNSVSVSEGDTRVFLARGGRLLNQPTKARLDR
ncbi:MAG TPA: hypothetical protein DDY70_01745, partial [Clostridiales bacterium]|nr:hypothetical protein [Clostridiales bacterium]